MLLQAVSVLLLRRAQHAGQPRPSSATRPVCHAGWPLRHLNLASSPGSGSHQRLLMLWKLWARSRESSSGRLQRRAPGPGRHKVHSLRLERFRGKTLAAVRRQEKTYNIVEKSRAPRPYYVDHHEAVSHQDVTTDYLAQDTKGSVIITVSWFPGLPCK